MRNHNAILKSNIHWLIYFQPEGIKRKRKTMTPDIFFSLNPLTLQQKPFWFLPTSYHRNIVLYTEDEINREVYSEHFATVGVCLVENVLIRKIINKL